MNGLPSVFWVWTVGFVAVASALFCGLILLTRGLHMARPDRRMAVILLWIIVATMGCWLLFQCADGEAAIIHRQNIGMAVVYFYFWLLAVVPAPLVGFGMARLLITGSR
jgi:hypothetical protein